MAAEERIAVVGAGKMGTGLVRLFARHGLEVAVWSRRMEAAESAVARSRAAGAKRILARGGGRSRKYLLLGRVGGARCQVGSDGEAREVNWA
jgi:3-hydroxyacyl-CoA dehydrogenase